MITARPKIAELVFRFYGRALHPELFCVCASRVFESSEYSVKTDVMNSGHVITFQWRGICLTEVATSAHYPLPQQRCYMKKKLISSGKDSVDCFSGIRYNTEYSLERVDPKIFWTFQEEIVGLGEHRGLLHRFSPGGRIAMGALSYIHVDMSARGISLQSLHTFPDDYALLKCQSRIELPDIK